MHSTASDGGDAPGALPRLAADAGLGAIALTDHDTTAGLGACAEAAAAAGVGFVPGIELSADPASVLPTRNGAANRPAALGTLHILGYFIDPDDPHLAELERRLREARPQRNPEIVAKLNALGVRIGYDEVVALAAEARGGAADGSPAEPMVGRPHIAQVLVRKGYVRSIHEAFVRYIGEGASAYARKDRLSAGEAIGAIHRAGGVAVMAHPVQLARGAADAIEHAAVRLRDMGLDGIEAHHADHAAADAQRFVRLAQRLGLLVTGGSDYHGSRKAVRLGEVRVGADRLEALRAAAEARRAGTTG